MPSLGSRSAQSRSGSAVALAAVVTTILLLTLWPSDPRPAFADDRFSARFGLADAVRNLLLFVPLGLALAHRGTGILGVVLRAALLSAVIELAQMHIPGRFANVSDFASNTAGALLGVILVRTAPRWLWPGRLAAQGYCVLWARPGERPAPRRRCAARAGASTHGVLRGLDAGAGQPRPLHGARHGGVDRRRAAAERPAGAFGRGAAALARRGPARRSKRWRARGRARWRPSSPSTTKRVARSCCWARNAETWCCACGRGPRP